MPRRQYAPPLQRDDPEPSAARVVIGGGDGGSDDVDRDPAPAGLLDSLPVLDSGSSATATVSAAERRATDGLVKEVSIPLKLSVEEIRNHRRLRLKITIDVNLLP
jgi:hypothetical protein